MRTVLAARPLLERGIGPARLRAEFAPVARSFALDWSLGDSAFRKRVVVLVSRRNHCLVDLLYRRCAGELDFDLPCVIGSHPDLRADVEVHGVPFHYIRVPRGEAGRQAAFAEIERLFFA